LAAVDGAPRVGAPRGNSLAPRRSAGRQDGAHLRFVRQWRAAARALTLKQLQQRVVLERQSRRARLNLLELRERLIRSLQRLHEQLLLVWRVGCLKEN